jgi:hypothetical protein
MSLVRVFVPVVVFLVLFGGLGLIAVNHKDAPNDMLKWVGMGTAFLLMLLYFGARIYRIVLLKIEVRKQLPDDVDTAFWVNCGTTRGWLTVKDGWLEFHSKSYCFKLSRHDFVNQDEVRRWGWYMCSARLRLPSNLPQMKVSLVPVFSNQRLGFARGIQFKQWIERWLSSPASEGKSLFPPISYDAQAKSTLDYALKFIVLDVVVSIGVGFIAYFGATSAPEALGGQTPGQGAMVAFIGCFGLFTAMALLLTVSYAIDHKKEADLRKAIDPRSMIRGERIFE